MKRINQKLRDDILTKHASVARIRKAFVPVIEWIGTQYADVCKVELTVREQLNKTGK